jgi:hypothetical protein
MIGLLDLCVVGEFELGDGDGLPGEAGLIDEQFSRQQDRVARNLSVGNEDVPADEVNVVDGLHLAAPEDGHFELLLCGLLDLLVGPVEQEVVDGGGDVSEGDHQNAENGHVFEDVDDGDQILKDEEGLRHRVEEVLQVVGHFHQVLVLSVK